MRIVESPDQTLNRAGRRASVRRSGALGATGVLVAGSAAALLAAFAGNAGAVSTITVDSAADGAADASRCTDGTPDNCTLRDAVAASADGDTITFGASISTITLTQGGLVTGTAVNITGPGSTALTITTTAAPGSYNAFDISGTGDVVLSGFTLTKNRIRTQNDGKTTVEDVTITGSTGAYGGALYAGNTGDLEITDSTFDNNTSSDSAGGVYVYNDGATTISGSSFTNNDAAGEGGGIFASTYGTGITITDSHFDNNYAAGSGGGAMFYAPTLSIQGSTFDNNVTARWGGAFYIMSTVTSVSITDSSLSGNTAGTGGGAAYIENTGDLSIIRTAIDDNTSAFGSGAMFINTTGNVTITDSSISGNTAQDGRAGGLYISMDGEATINNSTLSGNSATQVGGAIYLTAGYTLTINQSTITANEALGAEIALGGGGISSLNPANLTMSGTIVSGNTSAIEGSDDIGLYDSDTNATGSFTATHSIIGEVDPRLTMNGTNNISATDPLVGALADNGGPTRTMALLPGSPAIDAGPDPVATFAGNEFDQRGTPYVRIYNGQVDIGAFEVQPEPNPTTTTTTEPTTTTAAENEVVPAFTG